MSIWKKEFTLESLNAISKNTLVEHLDIKFNKFDEHSLSATMPVSSMTHQPFGMLHGGASVALMETVASLAANFCVAQNQYCVGLEVNANHIRVIKEGSVEATAKAVHLGKSTQIWQTDIVDQKRRLICTGRVTMAILTKPT